MKHSKNEITTYSINEDTLLDENEKEKEKDLSDDDE